MKWSKKRVLVTGAAGFIGSALTRRLTKLNAEPVILDNFSTGKKSNLSFFDGEIIESNVCDKNLSKKITGQIDYIFHFGAPSSVILFNNNPVKCFNETCGGFLNIMNLAKEKNVTKIVFPSSGSIYGKTPLPQKESDMPQTLNLYGVAKLTCERIARFFLKDVESIGLRIFAGYGPDEAHKGEIASPITLFLNSIVRNEQPIVYGDGRQSRDFVYIDDIVDSVIKSTENKTPPILNVGSGESYTFNSVISLINQCLKRNVKPTFISKPISYLENTLADINLMKEKLRIEPLSLKDGLERYLQTNDNNYA